MATSAQARAQAAETPGILSKLERMLDLVVEIPAGLLVLIELLILLAGVVSRYVFHAPITWSDELASVLFLWLAMLGSVVAIRRSEHMRMTALVNKAAPQTRRYLELLSIIVALVFLGLLMHPAIEYALDEIMITMPALEIPNIWRAAAMPVGIALMGAATVLRLLRLGLSRDTLLTFAIALSCCLICYAVGPVIRTLGNFNLFLFFVLGMGSAVLAGIPIVFAFGLSTFAYLALTTRVPMTIVVSRMDEGMSHFILLSIPLFVVLGVLIEMTGMARAMVNFLANLVGHFRGGLSYVLLGAMYLVSGISGSKAADMAAIAPVLFPEMKRRGAKDGELVALLSSSSAMSETIPPSLVLITIASVTGISIAALFTGGLLPAAVLAVALGIVVWYRARSDHQERPQRATRKAILSSFLIALPALVLPFLIRYAVVEGVATATEVSTIGVVYSVLAGIFVYRSFDWSRVPKMLIETASLSGAILIIVGAATAMAWALAQSGFSAEIARIISSLPGGAVVFMGVTVIAFVILGSILEGLPAIVLFGPLLFPVARQLGIHEIHYAIVVVLAMGIGLFAPPFGVGYYAACAIGKADPAEAMGPIWAYLIAIILGTFLVAAIPWLSIGFL
jgi:tripartite ATP-independent transporter DctM subunit